MRIPQTLLTDPAESVAATGSLRGVNPTLVLAFGAVACFERSGVVDELRRRFPQAAIAGAGFDGECPLHNQTMTIPWIAEDAG